MKHIYRPVRFYATVFAFTWSCWFVAILLEDGLVCTIALVLGLLAPSITATVTVFTSGDARLKEDFKQKITGLYRTVFFKPLSALFSLFAELPTSRCWSIVGCIVGR